MRRMVVAFPMIVMSSAFFNPSFAFSSHFDTDGAPLSELSWPSSLAVVAVSFSGLFTFVFLMLACLCCKKGDIGFKEFDNAEGEDYQADFTILASPSSQNGPEVYILPLTEVSLPVSKQPGRPIQLLKSSNLGRQSLLYLKEIGHGWFGKVLLGEVNAGLSTTQVVVKELKSSSSVQDQMQFLEEAQPYRTLQHPALLQCLAQCTEVTPYLLLMEFCPLGDVKSYLRTCRTANAVTPDPLILQRMACEIALGLLHLHKYNFIHSDLALRNCLLTSDMSVKIGDYGLSHSRYKEDYFVTPDQIWVPLRWISPELIDEVHGNLLVVDQTKASNVWTLGVTIWELFELGTQPYRHYSDRQVLNYAVKEQQLKLPKPQLKVPLDDRWYEVMQFCWLQPEQRPSVEEVHLLLTYLCAKGASGAEEDFEQRWKSLRPNLLSSTAHSVPAAPSLTPILAPDLVQVQAVELASSAAAASSSSFPLLEHFSSDGFHSDPGDDILTVTETSRGLNFEYKWEQARAEQPYCSSSTSGPLGQGNPHYQDIYYPITGSTSGACKASTSPSYYQSDPPGVVPVLSAHSPSVSSEYYIRIEEPVECNINLDDSVVDYSPGLDASHTSFSSGIRSGPPAGQHSSAYWSAAEAEKPSAYDSDASPTVSLTMEPLLRQAAPSSPEELGRSHHYFSPNRKDSPFCEQSPTNRTGHRSQQDTPSASLPGFLHPIGRLETPRGFSQPVSSPSLGYCDPYLEANQGTMPARSMVSESYCDMIGPLRKSLPIANHISIDVETGDGVLVGRRRGGDIVGDSDLFSEVEATNWTSNHSANNNSLTWEGRQTASSQDSYFDLHCTTLSSTTTDSWLTSTAGSTSPYFGARSFDNLETVGGAGSYTSRSSELDPYIHLCREGKQEGILCDRDTSATYLQNIDSLSNVNLKAGFKEGSSTVSADGNGKKPSTFTGERLSSEPQRIPEAGYIKSPSTYMETRPGALSDKVKPNIWEVPSLTKDLKVPGGMTNGLEERRLGHLEMSEASRGLDSGMETGAITLDIGDCSDEYDDITDVTSGIYANFPLDYMERDDNLSPLQNPVGTPDSADTMTLSCSAASPSEEAFSPDAFSTSILPKSLDSGYDTENNESPEFILKEHGGDSREGEGSPSGEGEEPELVMQVDLDQGLSVCTSSRAELQLKSRTDKGRYRDSAYFSDADSEKSPQEEGSNFFSGPGDQGFLRYAGKQSSSKKPGSEPQIDAQDLHRLANQRHGKAGVVLVLSEPGASPSSTPGLSMLTPFPPQMGGCLTKESSPDDGLGLETENSGEDPISECSSTLVSEPSSTVQEGSANHGQDNRGSDDYSPVQSLGSDSTIVDYGEEASKEREDEEGSTEVEEEEEEAFPEFNHVEEDDQMGRTPAREEEEEEEEEEEYGSQGGFIEDQNGSMEMLTTSCSFLELCGEEVRRAPLEEAEDDSDDSESDEELRTYNLQEEEESEESEEDLASVPVVVGDRTRNPHLRSLLKMPTLLSESFCDELDRKKKAVSFFDDVTVFLFDQESPTGELAEYSFPPVAAGVEPSGQTLVGDRPPPLAQPQLQSHPSSPQESVNASEDFDGNISQESGQFEWEEDFALVPSPSMEELVPDLAADPAPVSAAKAPENKPTAAAFSRFSVSRFSITHVSDSDMHSAGGSENGERE